MKIIARRTNHRADCHQRRFPRDRLVEEGHPTAFPQKYGGFSHHEQVGFRNDNIF